MEHTLFCGVRDAVAGPRNAVARVGLVNKSGVFRIEVCIAKLCAHMFGDEPHGFQLDAEHFCLACVVDALCREAAVDRLHRNLFVRVLLEEQSAPFSVSLRFQPCGFCPQLPCRQFLVIELQFIEVAVRFLVHPCARCDRADAARLYALADGHVGQQIIRRRPFEDEPWGRRNCVPLYRPRRHGPAAYTNRIRPGIRWPGPASRSRSGIPLVPAPGRNRIRGPAFLRGHTELPRSVSRRCSNSTRQGRKPTCFWYHGRRSSAVGSAIGATRLK